MMIEQMFHYTVVDPECEFLIRFQELGELSEQMKGTDEEVAEAITRRRLWVGFPPMVWYPQHGRDYEALYRRN